MGGASHRWRGVLCLTYNSISKTTFLPFMKKYLIFIFLIFPLISLAQTFERDLYFGIYNDPEVTKLQEFLTVEDVYDGPITGNFFSLTLQGVKNFQLREGIIPVAGYFGPITRSRANQRLSSQIEVSDEQAVQETGQSPIQPESFKTTDDVVDSLQQQIQQLLQQITLLQQQLQVQQETKSIVEKVDNKIAEQNIIIKQQTEAIKQQTEIITQQKEVIEKIQESTISLKPEIISFEASKYTADLGQEIALSWESKNAVTCAISETDNISLPFTGRLPSGSLTIKLAETVNLKIPAFKYYAICADKDWNTIVKTLTITVSPQITVANFVIRNGVANSLELNIIEMPTPGQVLQSETTTKIVLQLGGTMMPQDFEYIRFYNKQNQFEDIAIVDGKITIPETQRRILLNPKIKESGFGKTLDFTIESFAVSLGNDMVLGTTMGLGVVRSDEVTYPNHSIVIPEGMGNSELVTYCNAHGFTGWTYSWMYEPACMTDR